MNGNFERNYRNLVTLIKFPTHRKSRFLALDADFLGGWYRPAYTWTVNDRVENRVTREPLACKADRRTEENVFIGSSHLQYQYSQREE